MTVNGDVVRSALDRLHEERMTAGAASARGTALRDLDEVPGRAEEVRRTLVQALGAAQELDVARLGTDARDEAVMRARQVASTALDELGRHVEECAARALDWSAKQGPSDPSALLLAEMRQGRAWDRAKGRLGGGVPVRQLVDAAREAGDHETLSALLVELPAYVDGLGDDARAALRAGGSNVADLIESIDRVLAEVLPEAHNQREAHRVRLAANDGATAARRAIEHAAAVAGRYADDVNGTGSGRALSRARLVEEIRQGNEVQADSGGDAA